MAKTGRPKTITFKKPARVDFRLELDDKTLAIDELPQIGADDLSAYLRHCIKLLATGRAASIPDLHVTPGLQ